MKKIKTVLEIAAFIITVALLFFVQGNETKTTINQQKKLPAAKRDYAINENNSINNLDAALPGFLNSGLIIVNF